jgi:hypothetical protein
MASQSLAQRQFALESKHTISLFISLFASNLNGTNGFKLSGSSRNDRERRLCRLGGDANDDGFAAPVIGALRI